MADGKFSGVPAGSTLERKLESCVLDVKRQGKDKSSAIAICRASIKKEVMMVKKRGQLQKLRNRQKRREKRLQAQEEIPLEQIFKEDEIEQLTPEELDVIEKWVDDEEADDDIPEDLSKDIFYTVPGPKSLSELEEKRLAAEKTRKVRDVTWDTEDVISNIINDPATEVDEKVGQINGVASEMKTMINKILGTESKKDLGDFDYDLVHTELLLKDMNFLDKLEMLSAKTVLTSGARNALSDGDFALVTNRNGKKVRKYPIHDKTHVRNALARVAQMIKRGGQAAADARAALPKIRAAAKKFGIGKTPSKKNYTGFVIEKDANGDYRWVGWATNNRKDREKDFLMDISHKEFVEYLDNTPRWKIQFRPWHKKEYAFTHPVDAWMYKNGFMIYSGKLEENEAIRLMRIAQKEKLGMSHGFIPLERKGHNIEKYRTFEVSVLPLYAAANPYTSLEVISKEALSMKGKQEKFLRDVLGDENFEELSKETEALSKLLDEADIPSKDLTDEEDPALEDEDEEEDTDDDDEKSFSPEEEELIRRISKAIGIPELSDAFGEMVGEIADNREKFKVIGVVLKQLLERQSAMEKDSKKTAEDMLADMIENPKSKAIGKLAWMNKNRASQSDDTILGDDDEDAELKESFPKTMWLSEATNTKPLSEKFVKENS